jgi:glycosyltransferase involved in cell wall biosynthesis
MASTPRIHLAHDWLVGMRGGERVLDRLARQFGPTTIYTLVNDGVPLTEAIDACRIITSPLQRFPGACGRLRRWYLPMYPWAVERLRVAARPAGGGDGCDLLISTSSAVMKSIRPPRDVPHICYCHSPARYIWDQAGDYSHGRSGRLRAVGLRGIRRRFQRWDRATASRVTTFVANSRHTAERITRCYDRESIVVYPPVRTTFFTPDPTAGREDYLLVASALEPYKRIDLAIRAAARARARLVVAGTGSQAVALAAIGREAGADIEFRGRVTDEALRDLFRRAAALLHPQCEDFGITAVEAQACGCPVVAYAAGGAMETVVAETGIHFMDQSEACLADAIRECRRRSPDPIACRAHAERFAEQAFDDAMRAIVIRAVDEMR